MLGDKRLERDVADAVERVLTTILVEPIPNSVRVNTAKGIVIGAEDGGTRQISKGPLLEKPGVHSVLSTRRKPSTTSLIDAKSQDTNGVCECRIREAKCGA